MDNDIDVGNRLNELMQGHPLYRGRGQSALARDTGVPQPTINRILANKSVPEMATTIKLAHRFGVTVEWLLTGLGPKFIADLRASAPKSSGNIGTFPTETVTDPHFCAEIVLLIRRLQNLQTELQQILSDFKGLPSVEIASEPSHDADNSSPRAKVDRLVAAAKSLKKRRTEGKHGKNQSKSGKAG